MTIGSFPFGPGALMLEELSESPDCSLVEFEAFFLEHRPALVTFLRRKAFNEADAEDIAQESYMRLLGYGYGDSRHPAVWRSLLYRIAHNLAISQYRASRRYEGRFESAMDPAELASGLPCQERVIAACQDLALVRRALDQMTPKCRRVFLLSRAEGKTYPEIAGVCGISVKMVEKYMTRALGILRRAVGEAS